MKRIIASVFFLSLLSNIPLAGATAATDEAIHKATAEIKNTKLQVEALAKSNAQIVQALLDYMGAVKLKEAQLHSKLDSAPAPSLLDQQLVGRALEHGRELEKYALFSSKRPVIKTSIKGRPERDTVYEGLPEGAPPPADSISLHAENYCSKIERRVGLCSTTSAYAFRDLDMSSLLGHLSIPASDNTDADTFMAHLFPPMSFSLPPQIKDNNGKLRPEVAMSLKMQYRAIAMQSIGRQLFNQLLIQRKRIPNLAKQSGMPPEYISDPEGTAASPLELEYYESGYRFLSPEWGNKMSKLPTNGILREMANMMAFKLYMDFNLQRQVEQLSTLLATMLGSAASASAEMNAQGAPDMKIPTPGY